MNPYQSVRDALDWRIRRMLGDTFVDRNIVKIARKWRPRLTTPVFIGIAGSAGKTTTKELLFGLLSYRGHGVGTIASLNVTPEVAKIILRVRPKHDFCVVELSEDKPGAMDPSLALLQPSVGIVTIVGNDHLAAFDSSDALVAEMAKLVACLPASGTAVLNADDPIVLAMATNCAARILTYGVSPLAELRAEEITSVWPDRLQMTLVHGTERIRARTQLCGSHFAPLVLGAIGGGLATGMTLSECAEGIVNVAPFDGRMQLVSASDGVTFIRDDFKAPLWTVGACFKVMQEARAKRKIIVIGTLSDYSTGTGASKKYAEVAQRAQQVADFTVFVGPWASSVLKTRQPGREDGLRAFSQLRDAAEYINSITREGDLVLLKGTNIQDHLLRIILARSESVACWRDDCARDSFCTDCPHRNKPSGLPASRFVASPEDLEPQETPHCLRPIEAGEQVLIGLGNPDAKYAGTPHNVGYEVVDHLAVSAGLNWDESPGAWIARGKLEGHQVCLVKIRMAMNLTGGGLKRLAERMAIEPEQCILIFDDLDMPLGSVRNRQSGGAGGHRGVASILEAFQSDAFRRVKIGVDQEGAKLNRGDYVLTPFTAASWNVAEQALRTAGTHVLKIITDRRKVP